MSALLTTAYLPPVSYMAVLLQRKTAAIEHFENFQKQSYRNRCVIYGPNGRQSLSIPVEKPISLIKDVRISYSENWQQVHIKSIEAAYGNSPFFEILGADLFHIIKQNHKFLVDLNNELLFLILQWLRAEVDISFTETFEPIAQHKRDLREIIHPKKESLLDQPLPYYQQFSGRYGFMADLSVIDLLFHEGPLAWDYLMSARLQPL